MQDQEAKKLFNKGIESYNKGQILPALTYFEKADTIEKNPLNTSYLALCMAQQRGQIKNAIDLCESAIKDDPENSTLYLNLGKIYLHGRKKEDAIKAFREGLKHETNPQIIDELNKLGIRRSPIIQPLPRSHPINKYLGIILKRLKLR